MWGVRFSSLWTAMSSIDHSLQHTIDREELVRGMRSDLLPEDLRNAPYGETACEVCGVSFLVLSEMRTLQDRVDEAESRMAMWDDKIRRIRAIEEEREVARADAEASRLHTARMRDVCRAMVHRNTSTVRPALETTRGDLRALRAVVGSSSGDVGAFLRESASSLGEVVSRHGRSGRVLRARVEAAEKAAAKFGDELQRTEDELERSLGRERELVAARDELLRRMEAELQAAGGRASETLSRLQRSEASLREVEGRLARVEKEKEGAVRELQGERERSEALARELSRAQSVVVGASEERDRTGAALVEWRRRAEEAEGVRAGLERRVGELEALLRRRGEEVEALEEGKRASRSEAGAAAEREAEWRKRCEAADEALRTLRDGYVALEEELLPLRERVRELEEARRVEAQAAERAAREAAREAAERAERLERLERSGGEMRAEMDRAAEEMARMAREMQRVGEERQAAERKLRAGEAEVETLRRRVKDVEDERGESVLALAEERMEKSRWMQEAEAAKGQLVAVLREVESRKADAAASSSGDALVIAQLREEMGRANQRAQERIAALEATVHRECTERTFLLEQFNLTRAAAGLPPIDLAALAHDAESYVSEAERKILQSDAPDRKALHSSSSASRLAHDPDGTASSTTVRLPPLRSARQRQEQEEIEPGAHAVLSDADRSWAARARARGRGRKK
jgi:chromosome segregation ATPase